MTTAKLGTHAGGDGMVAANFDAGAVTLGKMSGALGGRYSGSEPASNTSHSIAHRLGRRPVITKINERSFEILSTSSTHIVVGPNEILADDPWLYDLDAI